MKAKAIKFLESLITENTPKGECDLIVYCKKCVKSYIEPEKKKQEFTPPTLEEIRDYVKEKGYNTNKIRTEGLLSQSTLQKFRNNQGVSWENIETLCQLLDCQPGDLLTYTREDV